jgi:hypothetical protein
LAFPESGIGALIHSQRYGNNPQYSLNSLDSSVDDFDSPCTPKDIDIGKGNGKLNTEHDPKYGQVFIF